MLSLSSANCADLAAIAGLPEGIQCRVPLNSLHEVVEAHLAVWVESRQADSAEVCLFANPRHMRPGKASRVADTKCKEESKIPEQFVPQCIFRPFTDSFM